MSEETEKLILEARNTSGGYFKEGYNCAESIFLTFKDYIAPEMDKDTVKLVTGFGSGLGEAGCMCGALTGSIFAINMAKGRTSKEQSRNEAYDYAKEFHDRFSDKFGATCCRALNPNEFETKEHLTTCLKITGNTGKMLMEFMLEKGIYKTEE